MPQFKFDVAVLPLFGIVLTLLPIARKMKTASNTNYLFSLALNASINGGFLYLILAHKEILLTIGPIGYMFYYTILVGGTILLIMSLITAYIVNDDILDQLDKR